MNDELCLLLEEVGAAASLLLMGAAGVRLLMRLTRVLRGQETTDGRANGKDISGAPRREVIMAAFAALASRLALYLLAYALYRLLGYEGGFAQTFERLWSHWDARHYIGIAQQGYTAVGDERLRLVFFPLYPLLMRLLAPVTDGSAFLSGTVISLVCACAASALLAELAYMHFGARAARWSVAYFLLSPLSVFLGCCYTESLFICLTLAVIVLLRRGHGWLAALCGMAGAFTRMPGVVAAGFFLIDALGKIGRRRFSRQDALRCLMQMALVFGGFALYLAVNYAVTGDAFIYLTYQRENWYQEPGAFWSSAANTVHYLLTGFGESDWFFTWCVQLIAMFFVFALLAFRGGALPFDLAAYAFVYVAVVLSPTWLLSGARYLYALAPLPLLKACMTRRPAVHAALLALSGVLLAVFVFGYTLAVSVF